MQQNDVVASYKEFVTKRIVWIFQSKICWALVKLEELIQNNERLMAALVISYTASNLIYWSGNLIIDLWLFYKICKFCGTAVKSTSISWMPFFGANKCTKRQINAERDGCTHIKASGSLTKFLQVILRQHNLQICLVRILKVFFLMAYFNQQLFSAEIGLKVLLNFAIG